MSEKSSMPPVLELAEKIKGDILQRCLRPGDSYMNTQEVARRFRVNGTTANRALQLLTQRGLLLRRQRTGTLVAEPAAPANAATIRRIHLFVHQQHLKNEGLLGDGMLVGLQRALPAAEIHFNYPPPLDEIPYIEGVIAEILRGRDPAGFILFRTSSPVQRLFENCGVPTVVSGTLQPQVRGLASIDRDPRQIGALLAEHLIVENCERVAIFMRELQTAGDHALLDAAFATLAAKSVTMDRVWLRALPHDPATIKAEVSTILKASKSRVGFLCRSEPLAQSVDAACAEENLTGRRKPRIVVADYFRQEGAPRFTHTQSTLSPDGWGEKIGSTLIALSQGEPPSSLQMTIPVRLVVP